MSLHIVVPIDEGNMLRRLLKNGFDFEEDPFDPELTRPDGARATYGPCDPPETR